MTGEPGDLEEVQRRLDEIQARKRDQTRWHMSRHTAELAIEAIAAAAPPVSSALPSHRGGTGKRRRRKRSKRLL